jgi:RimJ/RimL family protein N-acetyltransferase
MVQDPGEVHRGGRGVIRQHPGPADERLLTPRLELVPVVADDAEELAEVFGDERLYVFLASHPTTTEELRAQFARLAAARLADTEGTAQRNWTVRRRGDGWAVGMLQAAFSDQGRAAEIAWAVGVASQGQGIASEAARAVVGWLERRGVATITAHIHPDHHASATVATRAGLRPTGESRDHEGIGEQLWRRRVEALPQAAHPPAKERHTPTADGDPVQDRLVGYAAALHAKGAIRSQAVQWAFASVRRDRCVTSFSTPDDMVDAPQDSVPSAEVLDRVYSDQPLVTYFDERGAPAGSSSQPALVAEMLEALELASGRGCWRWVPAPATTPPCWPPSPARRWSPWTPTSAWSKRPGPRWAALTWTARSRWSTAMATTAGRPLDRTIGSS